MEDIRNLCGRIREIAFAIHVYLGHGHLEKVYENALAHRLRKAGLQFARQAAVHVRDEDGTLIGEFVPDLLVADSLLIELKSVRQLTTEHEARLLGYLKATSIEHGLLINFGAYRFQIRKFALRRRQPVEEPLNPNAF